MSTDDDDLDDLDPGPVPAPDAEPTAAERARARSFAELVDKVVAGRAPAAMSAEDRALVEVATLIRGAHRDVELPAARRSALVEQALRGAVDGSAASPKLADIVPLAARRARAPWIIASVATVIAAAAVLALVLRPAPAPRAPAAPPVAELPTTLRSRPADALVGVIPQERAGDASARIDAIFADRLDGFRALSLEPSRRGGR